MNQSVKTLLIAASFLMAGAAYAQRGDDADRVSKNGRIEGDVGGVSVVLEYGRPNANDRELWGSLVPYGEVWRTGANEATTIELAADAMVEGESLPAGTYSLFTIPSEGEWTVIFNKTATQWGAFRYDEGEDALRVMVTPGSGEHVEAMDFVIDGDSIVLRWGELTLPISISAG